MNYERLYYEIITNRKKDPYDGYTENHHIKPKSLGGADKKDNLVKLSAREHFICHYLLTKMFPKETFEWYKMIYAFSMMKMESLNQNRYFNSHLYESLKEDFSSAHSFHQKGIKNSQYGTAWYIHKDYKSLDSRKKYKIGIQPSDYITTKEWRANKVKIKKEEKLLEKINILNGYYEIYKKYGFEEFVKMTNYKYSKPNLVSSFAKYLEDFIPQNGKARKPKRNMGTSRLLVGRSSL